MVQLFFAGLLHKAAACIILSHPVASIWLISELIRCSCCERKFALLSTGFREAGGVCYSRWGLLNNLCIRSLLLCLRLAQLQDKVDTIRLLVIGVSAHQKLELLERLVTQLGYESVTVFGDCFDEVRWSIFFQIPLSSSLVPGSSSMSPQMRHSLVKVW